jgi:type I restriction enzyme S subunit
MRSEPAGWRRVRLGDQVDILAGFAFKSADFTDDPQDVRLLRGDNVAQGALRWQSAKRWPRDHADNLERYELQERDLILAMDRPWIEAGLKYAVVRRDDLPSLLVQRVARLRVKEGFLQEYLPFVIGGPEFSRYVMAVQTGTAVPHISSGQIADFEMLLPPIDEQTRIVEVLGALEDKIESNRRLSSTLADCLGVLFRREIVDAAADAESWRRTNLTGIARFINGRAFTKLGDDEGRPIVRIKELNNGVSGATPRAGVEASNDNVARHHDLLFSWSGSLGVYRWDGPESLINQHIFKVIALDGFPDWFVEGWIRHHMPEFQRIARDKATTMGHIKREHLKMAEVDVPPTERMSELDATMLPVDEQFRALAAESNTLRAIRDALLPRLTSGAARVPESADPDNPNSVEDLAA